MIGSADDPQSERLAIAAMMAVANGATPSHESAGRILELLDARVGTTAAMVMITEIAVGLVLGAADILHVDGRGLLLDAFRTLAHDMTAE
ncbi:MAG: hypothetical protein EON52_02315 [Actinomycetales bacterium]|nr:MAG: hypothetical protein EON52_02315 [Actinomycetales bacterium]